MATDHQELTSVEARLIELGEAEHCQRTELARIEHERRMEVIEADSTLSPTRTPVFASIASTTDRNARIDKIEVIPIAFHLPLDPPPPPTL